MITNSTSSAEKLLKLIELRLGVTPLKLTASAIFSSHSVNLAQHLYFAGMADLRIVGVIDETVDKETFIDSYRELTGKTPQWRESIKLLVLPRRLSDARSTLGHDHNLVTVLDDELAGIDSAKTLIAPLRTLIRDQLGTQRLSPYQSRGAVTGNRFFGRDVQLGAITKHPEKSYLVTGTRMSGKTSLSREAQRRLDEMGERAIYVDCKRFNSIAGLINGVLTELEVRDSFIKYERWQAPQRWHEFFRYLRSVTKQSFKRRLHIFLDEYDSLAELERPEAVISWNLRALHQENSELRGHIQFIFAGSRALASSSRNNESPFYNFVNPDDCYLDNFDLGTVRQILDNPTRDLGIKVDDPDLVAEKLLLETAGRPSSVQYLCEAVVKQIESGKQTTVSLDLVTQVAQSPEYHHYYQGIIVENTNYLERFILTVNSEKGNSDGGFTQENIISIAMGRYKVNFELKVLYEAIDNLVKSGFIILDRSVPGRYHIAAPVIKRICRVSDARSIAAELLTKKLANPLNF